MWPLVLLLPLLALAPFFCTDAGPGWPSMVRDRLLLVLAWSGTVALVWIEPGLGLFAGVVLCHWRSPQGVGALVTVGAGIALFLAARALPGEWFPLVTWAIVIGVVVQVVLALVQVALAVAAGQNWHIVRESARGTVGNRVVLGCLCAMAWPLATIWWVVPLLAGLLLTRSFSALVAAAVAAVVLYPPLWWVVGGLGVLGWMAMQYRRPTPVAGMHSRVVLAALCWKQMRRAGWRDRLLGFGSGSFFRSSKWWMSNRQTTELFKHAHNDAVQGAFEWGLIGLAAAVLFTGTLLIRGGLGAPMTAALAAVAVNALFQFPLHLPHVLVPVLVLAGMIGR
ncbi:MAG: hypothetical protein Q7J25_03650 [Vicinamibacterales bacterium]|nr:hypothetical protein [Vicinamibacterales bacterium]